MSTNPNVKETAVVQQRSAYLHIKRAQDVVLSLMGLVVLMPILLLIALIIVIESPGESPIFIQTRVGKNG